jgi:acyl-CoA thioester hydrolase
VEAFHWPVRVYWEDTDAGGVVYYANYLKFMERARSEWLRACGFEQDVLRDEAGVVFVVRRVEIDYLSPARFNDQLDVSVSLHETGRASLSVRQELMRGSTCLARAEVTLACVDAVRFKPVKIPPLLLQTLVPAT